MHIWQEKKESERAQKIAERQWNVMEWLRDIVYLVVKDDVIPELRQNGVCI